MTEQKKITLLEAVNLALHRAMVEDDNVVMLGEDIGVNGGVFRATQGLRERFGFKRVLDTPLAEAMIAGVSVGMAAQGLKPVMEIQFMGFIYPALDQLVSHASRLRNRTRGRLSCPMVLRTPMGAGIRAPEHHSESTEAMFAHIPGLRVVIPSSPARAYGLLLAAIDDPDPVIFLEPTRLYRMNPQALHDDGKRLPLDSCFTLREGSDLTLMFKSARDFGLNINYFTLNANNPGTPAQLGPWGEGKVGVIWNWVHNAPTPELEKIYVDYKKKTGDDFVFAAHWNSMHMLRDAMRKAQSTDAKKVALALEGMTYKSPMGEVRMRKTDHQLEAPLYLGIWAKQGSKGVKYDAEKTGYGFRSEVAWDNYISAQPTSCQMKRPS